MEIRNISSPATDEDLEQFPRRANISSHTKESDESDVFEDNVLGELVSQEPGNEPSSVSLRKSQAQFIHQEAVEINMQGHVLSWKNLSVKRGKKVILDNLNGVSSPGKITAIMGE